MPLLKECVAALTFVYIRARSCTRVDLVVARNCPGAPRPRRSGNKKWATLRAAFNAGRGVRRGAGAAQIDRYSRIASAWRPRTELPPWVKLGVSDHPGWNPPGRARRGARYALAPLEALRPRHQEPLRLHRAAPPPGPRARGRRVRLAVRAGGRPARRACRRDASATRDNSRASRRQ